MRRFIRKFRKSFGYGEKGFTLIELLIVLAILGAMAGAIIPNLSKFGETGNKSACLNEAAVVQTAVDAAMADGGITTIDQTAAHVIGPGIAGTGTWPLTDGTTAVSPGGFISRTITGTYDVDAEGHVSVTAYAGKLDTDALAEINLKLN